SKKCLHGNNFYDVKYLNDTLSPLLRDNGRIVNVSSGIASLTLERYCKDLQVKLLDPNITESQLEQIFTELFRVVQEGNDFKTIGFNLVKIPNFDDYFALYYGASNLGANILTLLCVQGFCATDINNRADGGRPAELGADSILHAVYTENLENGQFSKGGTRLPLEANR
ncbi:unnamed protein product, partial [Adineta ricciae]